MWRVRGGTLTSIDGYDSEILSACEMEPSKEAAKRGRKKNGRTRNHQHARLRLPG